LFMLRLLSNKTLSVQNDVLRLVDRVRARPKERAPVVFGSHSSRRPGCSTSPKLLKARRGSVDTEPKGRQSSRVTHDFCRGFAPTCGFVIRLWGLRQQPAYRSTGVPSMRPRSLYFSHRHPPHRPN
jgi:hypothetical protein